MSDLFARAAELVFPADTVVDIGCGIRPQKIIRCKKQICVDAFLPYLERLKAEWDGCAQLECVHQTMHEFCSQLPEPPADAVVLLDVVEHCDKAEAQEDLARLVQWARQQVIVFTPLGFMPQAPQVDDSEPDPWGMGGWFWQRHRSGWTPEDFPGWTILVDPDDDHGRAQDHRGSFFAILTRRDS